MKKLYLTALFLGAFTLGAQAQVVFTDDFESYDLGPISSQTSNWRVWSANWSAVEDAKVSDDEARSGVQGLYIDNSQVVDPIFLVPGAPTNGIITVQWYAFIPAGKAGYWNMQGALTAAGVEWNQHLMGGNVYMNCNGNMPGEGGVTGQTDCSTFDAVFYYPEDEWFKVTCIYDLDQEVWALNINDVEQFSQYPFEFNNYVFTELAGIDFYSATNKNELYLDDFTVAHGILSTENFAPEVFSVYPNPATDVLNIQSKVAVEKVTVFDTMGRTVLQATPNTISPAINISGLSSGTYFVKVTIDNNSKIVKILK